MFAISDSLKLEDTEKPKSSWGRNHSSFLPIQLQLLGKLQVTGSSEGASCGVGGNYWKEM